jgi:simple sugar transport system permease protein
MAVIAAAATTLTTCSLAFSALLRQPFVGYMIVPSFGCLVRGDLALQALVDHHRHEYATPASAHMNDPLTAPPPSDPLIWFRRQPEFRWQFWIAPLLAAVGFLALSYSYYNGSPLYTIETVWATIVQNSLAYCLLGLGSAVVLSAAQLDLSVVGVASLSGVLATIILSSSPTGYFSLDLALSLVCSLFFAVLSGVLVSSCVVHLRAPALIFTWALGALYIIFAIILVQFAPNSVIHSASDVTFPINFPSGYWGFNGTGNRLSVILVIAILIILNGTNLPTLSRAIGGNPVSAAYAGVPTRRTLCTCFILSATLAALAGIYEASYMGSALVRPFDGKELVPLAVAVLGGAVLTGGYLSLLAVVAASLFWGSMDLLGPQLPALMPFLVGYEAELGQALFYTCFAVVCVIFGKKLAPDLAKVYVKSQ